MGPRSQPFDPDASQPRRIDLGAVARTFASLPKVDPTDVRWPADARHYHRVDQWRPVPWWAYTVDPAGNA